MAYKKNYIIGIYEKNEEETCAGIFESPQELADYLNTSLHSVHSILHKILKGEQEYIVVGKKLYNLELLELD